MDAVLLAAIFFTALLSGVFGMAGGLLLLAFLTARMPLPDAMVLHGAAQLVANGSRALISGAHVQWRVLLGYAVGAVCALLLAAALELQVATSTALIITGSSPFVEPWFKQLRVPSVERPRGALLCGGVATALHLVAGTAGPLLDVFFLQTKLTRHAMVATKAATQVLGHGAKVCFFMLLSRAPAAGIALSASSLCALALASVLGTLAGRHILDRLSEAWFRRAARILVLCIGAYCIAQGLYALSQGR
jgi:uncharacterized membrane protein YfcA